MNQLFGVVLISAALMAGCAAPGEDSAKKGATSAPTAATSAVAPNGRMTVGDLLAKGGKQLTVAEAKELFTGATMGGDSPRATWRTKLGADGKFSGQASLNAGGTRNFFGDWWVDDKGRNCSVDRSRSNTGPDCMYYFTLGGKYYASVTDSSNPNAALADRFISK